MTTMKMLIVFLFLAMFASACSSPPDDSSDAAAGAPKPPCNVAGSTTTEGRLPGDLVDARELTAGSDDADFPSGARAWRILYVSTGIDNNDLRLVCGVVVAPADESKIEAAGPSPSTGRLVTWSHGTLGVTSRCQPSMDPGTFIWGPMAGGFNVVAWGKAGESDGRLGDPSGGALQYMMMDQGWVVDQIPDSRSTRHE